MQHRVGVNFIRRLISFRYSLPVSPQRTKSLPKLISMTTITTGLCLAWPFSRRPPSLDEQNREHLYNASRLIAQQRYSQADEELHVLLKMLANAKSANQLTTSEYAGRRARVFAELANLRALMGDAEGAEGLLVQTMRDLVAAGVPPGGPLIVELSLKLALVYVKLGLLEKALSGFDFCVMMQKQNISDSLDTEAKTRRENLVLLGLIYNSYGHFLVTERQLIAGKKMLEEALETARALYPEDHDNCLTLLLDLANVESQLDDVTSAEAHFQEVTNLVKDDNYEIRTFGYAHRAMFDGLRGDFEAAGRLLADAVATCSKIPETKNREAAQDQIKEVEAMLSKWKADLKGSEETSSD